MTPPAATTGDVREFAMLAAELRRLDPDAHRRALERLRRMVAEEKARARGTAAH